jgi:hypothetical protein
MMRRDFAHVSSGLLLFAGGACAGVIGSILIAPAPARDAARAANPNEISDALARLADEVSHLNERLARAPDATASAPAREAAAAGAGAPGASSRSEEEMLVLLRRLSAALAAPSPGVSPGSVALAVPESPSPQERAALGARFKGLGASRDEREAEITRSHVLLTYQQILDRYGRPDDVSAFQGGMTWTYKLSKDEDGGETLVWFDFADGIVVGGHYNG